MFGLDEEEYERLFKQQKGVCWFCKIRSDARQKRLAVDHDHRTGTVRGLLCGPCNTNLGWFENHREKVTKYCEKF
jgi:hypothetical protein